MSTLKCKCQSFEATFDAPPRLTFNCHCHSCVAVVKGIEARDGFSGTSMKSDEAGGAAVAVFKSNNVTVTKVDGAKIGFMKVGEGGKVARPYCTECGTVLFNVWAPKWCAVNRNAMTAADGSPFVPKGPVLNINAKSAFDKDKVPEPKHGSVTVGMLVKFIPLLTGLAGDGSNSKVTALMAEDLSKVESVPITWE
ncbi:hypothetical protein ACHAW5_002157 [Stephanodiscus triporus]|uniref:CENP-V/GFA domain-containing protein n=1 Tax=Stephanodiscus triporus TaxID=2934178 RepID=A0ABD3Q447_9STRA